MLKILCLVLGHKRKMLNERDMFGLEYVWQKEICDRCGKRLN